MSRQPRPTGKNVRPRASKDSFGGTRADIFPTGPLLAVTLYPRICPNFVNPIQTLAAVRTNVGQIVEVLVKSVEIVPG